VQRLRTREELHRIFYTTRFLCRLDRLGYAISAAGSSMAKKPWRGIQR
jgi:hypothetical protein